MTDSRTPQSMRSFIIIWAGQVISIIGSGLTSFALGVWLYTETGQATPFAITVLLGSLPRILLSPLGGSLADRWNRRWLMILSDTANALLTLVVVFLVLGNHLTIASIYLVAFLGSIFSAFQEPAYSASIPMLVPKKDLPRANGLIQLAQSTEMLISPVLAGVLFGLIGLQGIILIDFVTYFFGVAALFIVRIPQPEALPVHGQSRGLRQVFADAAFGWNYLKERTGLFILMFYFAAVNFLLNFASVLTGPLVLSRHSAGTLGVVQMVSGVGMLAGSLVMSAWGGPRKRIHGVIGFIALSGVGLALIGLTPGAITISLGYFVMMFAIPLASGCSVSIAQTKIAPGAQGRTNAIRTMISRSMMPLAYLISGPLADNLFEPAMRSGGTLDGSLVAALLGSGAGRGMGLMYVLAGIFLLIVTALAATHPRIRNVESELPDLLPDTAPTAVESSATPVAG